MCDIKLDLAQIKRDLSSGIVECSGRGLNHSAKFLAELNHALSHIKAAPCEDPRPVEDTTDLEVYFMAKSYLDLRQYDRCAHFTKNTSNSKAKFLYYYAKYLSIEKKKLDSMTDANCSPNSTNSELSALYTEMRSNEPNLDGYCLYLYGVILRKLDIIPNAISALVRAVNCEPLLWCAWYELGKINSDRNNVVNQELPNHWMKYFFLGHASLEHLNNNEGLQIYFELSNQGLQNSTYIMAQKAIGYHNLKELEQAIAAFEEIIQIDPYRLDNLDIYSNLLYVKEMKTELASLAHKAVQVDKYRVETCCVIGNYYSLRSDHPKAVLYFQRALKLNPEFLSALTLMGHEYMEMKNTNAAIQSYRRAIEINSRDYRAWYGLGQTYEILKMPFYSLYYYKQAQQLRPNDSRMIMALAETYERLDKTENALKCYYKACKVGDLEGHALIKLAKLYDKLQEFDNAAAAFTEFCLKEEEIKASANEDQMNEYYYSLHYLANYHLKKGNLDDAYEHAYKCLECEKTKDGAKAILKDIASKRSEMDSDAVPMDETCPDNLDD